MKTLEGQTVIVVGAGSGIGFGVAQMALAERMNVVAVGRTKSKLEAHQGARTIQADITKEADVANVFAEVGAFHHLVVTAQSLKYGAVGELAYEDIIDGMGSKLATALLLAKHASKTIDENGSISFTSGIARLRPMPRASIAASANAGLDGLVRALAVELSPVRVNVISPGWVETPVWDRLGYDKADLFAKMKERLLVKRIGTPADIAHAFRFLMENGFVTGTSLEIDGGHRLV